jgi:heme exporter protein C
MRGRALLPWAAVGAVVIAVAMIFFYAPTEAVQGDVQRIFYIHVPSAWLAYIAFIIVAAASIMVLARRNDWERWDRIAVAGAEVGVLFTSIVLTTGPIWARRVWGVWWAWDARLTSTLVLWLIYVGYLAFRGLAPPDERRARLGAVIGVVGAIDIPVVHFAVTWWLSAHPDPTVLRAGGPDLPGQMMLTLLVSFVALALVFATFLLVRIRIEEGRSRIELALEGTRV